MNVSYNWLKELVPHNLDCEQLSDKLTMSGLEVETIEKLNNFSNVVIAHVLSVQKHTNADKLKIVKVDIGNQIIQIVCGANNVDTNIKVPCALVGACLPNNVKISQVTIRGVQSNGMLCSADELALGKSEGLLILPFNAPTGESILNYLDLNDYVINIKITPNRSDCLSIKGIARELSILTNIKQNPIKIIKNKIDNNNILPTAIQEKNYCRKILTRIIKNVDNTIPTPIWIIQKLQKSNIKSISFLVDITNYVMIELGQPMHVYDLDKIKGNINVRNAKEGEKLLCLNDKLITLNNDTLVISDSEKILSLAGIIGGKDSSVSLETKNILLESAFFIPDAIIGKSRKYGITSQSSYRFERGVDFNLQEDAIERATSLIVENTQSNISSINRTIGNAIEYKKINLNLDKVKKILGIEIPKQKIYKILKNLQFNPEENNLGFTITSPSFRFDINLEIDIIEEIARIFGYNNIINQTPYKKISILNSTNNKYLLSKVYNILINKGYHEVINYSFVNYEWEKDFNNNTNPIYLKNPIISHLNVMQSSLIGNLIFTLKNNLNRKHERVKIFEIATIFYKDANQKIIQEKHLGGLAYGNVLPEQWSQKNQYIDFFNIKNDVELLLNNKDYFFAKTIHPAFHPGKSANIYLNNEIIGFIGEIHPKWIQKYNIENNILIFEIKLEKILQYDKIQYQEISKFQPIIRDISFIMPKEIEFQELLNALKQYKDETIKKINIFDIYEGENIAKNMKSISIRITFQHKNKIIQSNEIDQKINMLIIQANKIGVTLR